MLKGVIFANRQAFDGKQTAVFNYYKTNVSNVDELVTKWSEGIDSKTTNEVLMIVDSRLDGFPWSPEQVVDISLSDTKWFNNDTL